MPRTPTSIETPGKLALLTEYLLSLPPAKAGMRLRSQRALAERWRIDRNWIRKVFSELVASGILVQRHGSGTYLRRVPSPSTPVDTLRFSTEDLLDPSTAMPRRALTPSQGALRIGIVADLHWPAPTRTSIHEELIRQAQVLGHHVVLTGITSSPGCYFPEAAIEEALPHDCDAYLVHDDAADALMPILTRRGLPFAVFDALDLVRHQPTVISNLDEAVERAVSLLAAQGWLSVGLLSYADSRNLDLEQSRYRRGLRRNGLHQCPCMAAATLKPLSIRNALQELLVKGVDSLYVADDNLLDEVARELRRTGRTPGRDIGVIAMTVRGIKLPGRITWSRMVFDPAHFAQRTLQALLASLQRADTPQGNLASLLLWESGNTHRRTSRGAPP